jgi:hypothetical protein
MESKDIYEKIIRALEQKGPSLPIRLSRDVGLSSLFISAFLSELNAQKRVRMSKLKVGGSPLYLLPGQEKMLENFLQYLHPKELEAFQLLKEKKVLKDSEQTPQTRVALRSIADFAFGFQKGDEILWNYAFALPEEIDTASNPEENIKNKKVNEEKILEEKEIAKENVEVEKEIKVKDAEKERVEEEPQRKEKIEKISIQKTDQKRKPELNLKEVESKKLSGSLDNEAFNNPLVAQEKPNVKEKPKSRFVEKVIGELNEKYKIIEEKGHKPKEYIAIVQIKSELGPINLFTVAKDKKKIADSDLKKVLSDAQSIPLPALFVHNGVLSKKAIEYCGAYFSILKILKL